MLAYRWKHLPSDAQTAKTLVCYAYRLVQMCCTRRPSISTHMSSVEHFPRPPRTPSPSSEEIIPEVSPEPCLMPTPIENQDTEKNESDLTRPLDEEESTDEGSATNASTEEET